MCEQPLAAADYLRIAHDFHTVLLDRIPVMDYPQRNEARRFIILIDTFYDNAVKLIATAAAEPEALYCADDGFEAQEFAAPFLAWSKWAPRPISPTRTAVVIRPRSALVDGIVET